MDPCHAHPLPHRAEVWRQHLLCDPRTAQVLYEHPQARVPKYFAHCPLMEIVAGLHPHVFTGVDRSSPCDAGANPLHTLSSARVAWVLPQTLIAFPEA